MKKSSEVLLVAAALLLSFVIPSLKAGSDAKEQKIVAVTPPAKALTDQQKTALQELRQQARAAGQLLKADPALSPSDKLAKLRELKQGCRDQARLITAPELVSQPATHRT